MSKFLLVNEPEITIQKTILEMFKYEAENMSAPVIKAILLQKIHEESCIREIHTDEFSWVEYSYNELSEWSTYGLQCIRLQIRLLIEKNLLKTKEAVNNAKTKINDRKIWYRVNYKKLSKLLERHKKIKEYPTYKGLNKYSWKRLKGAKKTIKSNKIIYK